MSLDLRREKRIAWGKVYVPVRFSTTGFACDTTLGVAAGSVTPIDLFKYRKRPCQCELTIVGNAHI